MSKKFLIEQIWEQNLFTAEGGIMHDKAHEEQFELLALAGRAFAVAPRAGAWIETARRLLQTETHPTHCIARIFQIAWRRT